MFCEYERENIEEFAFIIILTFITLKVNMDPLLLM